MNRLNDRRRIEVTIEKLQKADEQLAALAEPKTKLPIETQQQLHQLLWNISENIRALLHDAALSGHGDANKLSDRVYHVMVDVSDALCWDAIP
jgi:hypothetical protein